MSFWQHLAYHAGKEAIKSAGGGCMVTLLAILTGLGTILTVVGIVILN